MKCIYYCDLTDEMTGQTHMFGLCQNEIQKIDIGCEDELDLNLMVFFDNALMYPEFCDDICNNCLNADTRLSPSKIGEQYLVYLNYSQ